MCRSPAWTKKKSMLLRMGPCVNVLLPTTVVPASCPKFDPPSGAMIFQDLQRVSARRSHSHELHESSRPLHSDTVSYHFTCATTARTLNSNVTRTHPEQTTPRKQRRLVFADTRSCRVPFPRQRSSDSAECPATSTQAAQRLPCQSTPRRCVL